MASMQPSTFFSSFSTTSNRTIWEQGASQIVTRGSPDMEAKCEKWCNQNKQSKTCSLMRVTAAQ